MSPTLATLVYTFGIAGLFYMDYDKCQDLEGALATGCLSLDYWVEVLVRLAGNWAAKRSRCAA